MTDIPNKLKYTVNMGENYSSFCIPGNKGPPLRIFPIGGLGEIGMNCMLIGTKDRYIMVDAGLMFPDAEDMGMHKIIPDISFLTHWKENIFAVVITHGHEDHIGALSWVLASLEPSTIVYVSNFVFQLVKRRMIDDNLWNEKRFKCFS